MEEEHEVYGGDIPEDVEGDMETDLEGNPYVRVGKDEDGIGEDAASKVSGDLHLLLNFILHIFETYNLTFC